MKIPDNMILECTRFQQVIDARSNLRAKLGLFTKLKQSEKFAEAAKPYCFAMLVEQVVKLCSPSDLAKLYDAMEDTQAADTIRLKLTQDEYEQVFGLVVRKALEAAPLNQNAAHVFDEIQRSGISFADAQTVSIAIFAGVDASRLDRLCDILLEKSPDRRRGNSPRAASEPLAA